MLLLPLPLLPLPLLPLVMIDYKNGICEEMKLFIFEWVILNPEAGKGIKYVRQLNKQELIKVILYIEGKLSKQVLMTEVIIPKKMYFSEIARIRQLKQKGEYVEEEEEVDEDKEEEEDDEAEEDTEDKEEEDDEEEEDAEDKKEEDADEDKDDKEEEDADEDKEDKG